MCKNKKFKLKSDSKFMENWSISSVGTYFTTIRMATMIATRTNAITISAHIPKIYTQSENAKKKNFFLMKFMKIWK